MRKKVMPVYFDVKERQMIDLLAVNGSCSRSEAVRRAVRSTAAAAIPPKALERASIAALNGGAAGNGGSHQR